MNMHTFGLFSLRTVTSQLKLLVEQSKNQGRLGNVQETKRPHPETTQYKKGNTEHQPLY